MSISYSHSPHFSFQIRCISAPLPLILLHTVVELSYLISYVGGCFLDYPLDRVLQTYVFNTYLIIYFLKLYDVLIWWSYLMMHVFDASCLERDMCFMMIINNTFLDIFRENSFGLRFCVFFNISACWLPSSHPSLRYGLKCCHLDSSSDNNTFLIYVGSIPFHGN